MLECVQDLLGNHQIELAKKLGEGRHLVWGQRVGEALQVQPGEDTMCILLQEWRETRDSLVPFRRGEPALFTGFLDNLMGV